MDMNSTFADIQNMLTNNDEKLKKMIKYLTNKDQFKKIEEGYNTQNFYFFMAIVLQGFKINKKKDYFENFLKIAYENQEPSNSKETWRRNVKNFIKRGNNSNDQSNTIIEKFSEISVDTKIKCFFDGTWYDLVDNDNKPIFYTTNNNEKISIFSNEEDSGVLIKTGEQRAKEQMKQIVEILVNGVQNTTQGEFIVMEDIHTLLETNKQLILNGAPGTGKTWTVKSFVEKIQKEKKVHNDIYKFVQFHSSYDYTDFVEGLRPAPDKNGGNMFVRMDGIFKSFCRKIVKENLEKLSENKDKLMTIEEYYEVMKEEEKRKEIYRKLNENPYYFIIDEINRADLSRVFGELMYGLEESYREVHNRFDTQYKNLPTYEVMCDEAVIIGDDCFKDGFFIPYNLYIIGTMNDIDRSVESFDFALRRRFVWVDIKANDIMCESLKSMYEKEENKSLSENMINEISERICKMNNVITKSDYGFSEAYHIGPAYFKDFVKASDENIDDVLRKIFKNRIEPILHEYMRGRNQGVQDKLIKDCRVELLGELNEKN